MKQSIVEKVRTEIAEQIKNKQIMASLMSTTFKGLDVVNAQKALLEGMLTGFTFKDFLEKNIYAVPYANGYSLITSIDYVRKIAMRNGLVGKSAPVYTHDDDGNIISCTITIKVKFDDYIGEFTETVYFAEFTTGRNLWKTKPHKMIAKCFSSDTEVLTDSGFMLFSEITDEKIMQVTDKGLVPVSAKPFMLKWSGRMISRETTDLDFDVTDNHMMVTNHGKVEAGAIYDSATSRAHYYIPKTVKTSTDDYPIDDKDIELMAVLLADGCIRSANLWETNVSRGYKVRFLDKTNYRSRKIRKCAGNKAVIGSRTIRTSVNQKSYTHEYTDVLKKFVKQDKSVDLREIAKLSLAQARLLVDTWIMFDGNISQSGTKRIYTSRHNHIKALHLLGVIAGYSVGYEKLRADNKNYYIVFSETESVPITKSGNIKTTIGCRDVVGEDVWCVTVPSGVIIVRRNNFSYVCGNCAEMGALRQAFPEDLSQLYSADEMESEIIKVTVSDDDYEAVFTKLAEAKSVEELQNIYLGLDDKFKGDDKVVNYCRELKQNYANAQGTTKDSGVGATADGESDGDDTAEIVRKN